MDETVHLRDERNVPTARHVLRAFFAVLGQRGHELVSTIPEEDSADVEAAQRSFYGLLLLIVGPVR